MNIDEFVALAATETEKTVVHAVASPNALDQAGRSGGMGLGAFLSRGRKGKREVRYRHILGGPASEAAISSWEGVHGELPDDLRQLVARMNGVHLWANTETGRAYTGLAPIEEWEPATSKFFGAKLDDRLIAVSYHADGAAYVVLDLESGRYFLMDVAGPDMSVVVGASVDELLNWMWTHRILPKGLK